MSLCVVEYDEAINWGHVDRMIWYFRFDPFGLSDLCCVSLHNILRIC